VTGVSTSARIIYLFFFFSSRRRHTTSKRDWSSDVCSSDLAAGRIGTGIGSNANAVRPAGSFSAGANISVAGGSHELVSTQIHHRSEERRVGKESRSCRQT